MATPTTMRAVAVDAFGGVEKLGVHTLPVPQPGEGEVLIRVDYAGVAVWDVNEREGHFDGYVRELTGGPTRFPLVLGSEGAGAVAAIGPGVTHVKVGDAVYASSFLNPRGGFYAEYAVAPASLVRPIPRGLSVEQAAVFGGDAFTALRGLRDVLKVQPGERVLIFGAAGGLGHLALQIAKRLGAHVLAVASGADGVALAESLGADVAVDGRRVDVLAAAKRLAPDGIDAALFTAGGDAANKALGTLKPTGRAAAPNGVEPLPSAPGVDVQTYDGNGDAEILSDLDDLVIAGPFTVHVARTFHLEQAADAHRFLGEHYLGKLALKTH